jgi:hypothetical protein
MTRRPGYVVMFSRPNEVAKVIEAAVQSAK